MSNAPMERMLLKILFSHWLNLAEKSSPEAQDQLSAAQANEGLVCELKAAITELEKDDPEPR